MKEERKKKKNKTHQPYNKDNKLEAHETAGPTEKGNDPYQKYKDFKWENPDQMKNGPVTNDNRKCRDVVCCIIFLVIFAACAVVGFFGFKNGDPTLLLYTYDEEGKACGHSPGYEDYPYLYFYSVLSGMAKLESESIVNGVCVSSCPNETLKKSDYANQNYTLDCHPTANNPTCGVSYLNYYESKDILGRICFPKSNDELVYDNETQVKIKIYDPNTGDTFEKVIDKDNTISDQNDPSKVYILASSIDGQNDPQDASAKLINFSFFSQKFSSWISDLNVTKYAIAASIGWCFVLCLIFLLFLRLCAGFVTFFIIVAIEGGLIVLAVYFKMTANDEQDETTKTAMDVIFYIFVGLAVIWFIFVLVMCNRIRLAIALVQVTSKYIMKNCCIVFVPLFFFLLLIIWIIYWIIMLVFLYASGDFDAEGSKIVASFKMDDKLVYCFWFHIFALFYITAVISAYSQFVYASSACIWYFTSEKGTEDHPIAKSFFRGIRYHFGSICFGATIIAIIRFIMFFLEYVKKKLEASVGTGEKKIAKCFKCIISCCQCCLGCCAKVMEYINKHAYIQIALKGDSFCTAAFEGFGLLIRNLGRFSMLAFLGGILSIFGTIFITVSSALIGYFVITEVDYFSADLNSCILPVIAFGIVGFILGHVTMSIFSVSGDALIHSFLLDEEINKGLPKAFPELQKFMSEER